MSVWPLFDARGRIVGTAAAYMNVWSLFDARGRIIGTAAAYTNVESPESRPSWYDAIKGVVAHSDTHYMDNLSLAGLARIAGVSETRFRRLFLNVMDITPGRYLVTIRLNAARRMPVTTNRLIADIATVVGFWDQSHFVKAFKRERDETPSHYRMRHWAASGRKG